MMSLKLIAGQITPLLLSPYYALTVVNLEVGNAVTTSCVLKIGDEEITFKKDPFTAAGILTVDGNAQRRPKYTVLPPAEQGILLLLNEQEGELKGDIILNYMLSYEVPVSK